MELGIHSVQKELLSPVSINNGGSKSSTQQEEDPQEMEEEDDNKQQTNKGSSGGATNRNNGGNDGNVNTVGEDNNVSVDVTGNQQNDKSDPTQNNVEADPIRTLRTREILALYSPHSMLGSGNFGEVWTVVERGTRRLRVWKRIPKHHPEPEYLTTAAEFLTEVQILQHLQQDGWCRHFVPALHDAFQDNDYYYMIMEYYNNTCNLKQFIDAGEHNVLMDDELMYLVEQLVQGLQAIHSLGVAHVDVKPDNILVHPQTLNIRYIDFGFACWFQQPALGFQDIGTKEYQAPELSKKDETNAYDLNAYQAADIWSLGVVFEELSRDRRLRIPALDALLERMLQTEPADRAL